MRTDLKSWVVKALKSSDDNPQEAIEWLQNQRDPDLVSMLVRLGSQQVVRTFYSNQRLSAMTMATGRVAATLGASELEDRTSSRLARRAFWESYSLYGMTPIKDATKADLLHSASMREQQARTEIFLASFERAVAAKLKRDEDTVSSKFTNEALEAMAALFKEKHHAAH